MYIDVKVLLKIGRLITCYPLMLMRDDEKINFNLLGMPSNWIVFTSLTDYSILMRKNKDEK